LIRVRPSAWAAPGRAAYSVPFAVALAAAGIAGCDRPPSESEAKEWTPGDHSEEKGRPTNAQAPQPRQQGDAGDGRILIEMTWRNQCAQCHGPIGHGDGPNGPMVQAKDLTKEDWQKSVTDAQLAESIKNGKNRMPKFDLPDAVVQGLVVRIRASKGH
jgi:cytochrome c oxidase cbb3-type subunit 3